MKKSILSLVIMLMSMITSATAATPVDTIRIDYKKIERVVEHETKNTKGNKVIKYFFVYDHELISTTKNVAEKYNLCKKYNARCAMVIVKRGNNKRIILN